MADDMTSAVVLPIRHRLRLGVRHPRNWLQLVRFAAVGASGYAVNLAVFALCVHVLGIDYRVAAVIAFIISVVNNFWWNRHWTFDARHVHPLSQGARFFAVSLVAFGFQYLVLTSLVGDAGLNKVLSQAIAIVCATPLSFVGQKLWSFRA
ncbi:MAG TPA: GtrA family protein [Solirubrobacteraceae bacterium]|jgi:dolichol-phosphate mannosyltransferase|nr:GtrA family protein [Solirubrobacteraceae bacterium]